MKSDPVITALGYVAGKAIFENVKLPREQSRMLIDAAPELFLELLLEAVKSGEIQLTEAQLHELREIFQDPDHSLSCFMEVMRGGYQLSEEDTQKLLELLPIPNSSVSTNSPSNGEMDEVLQSLHVKGIRIDTLEARKESIGKLTDAIAKLDASKGEILKAFRERNLQPFARDHLTLARIKMTELRGRIKTEKKFTPRGNVNSINTHFRKLSKAYGGNTSD